MLTACQTGPRPTITDERTTDPAVRTVSGLLDDARTNGAFTATYEIAPTAVGTEPVRATVANTFERVEIVIGEVLYVVDASAGETCDADRSNCVSGVDDARISNLGITHAFWADSAAARLRTDAGRAIGNPQSQPDTIADQPAECVAVPVAGGTIEYCALEAGPLARYRGADATIELTSFTAGT